MGKVPEEGWKEALWQRVEDIAFEAIRDISTEIAELPDTDKEEIYKRFDAIALECLRRNESPSSAVLH